MPQASGRPADWHAGPVDPKAVESQWRGERVDLDYVASVLAQRRKAIDEGGGPDPVAGVA